MRENVDELLAKHSASIAELRTRTADVLPQEPMYDEIFLLRYVLTHSKKGSLNTAEAESAVRKTIVFRKENEEALEEEAARSSSSFDDIMTKFICWGRVGDLGGLEPMFITRTGYVFPKGLMRAMSEDEIVRGMLLQRERVFREMDEKTRKSRMMIRCLNIWDMTDSNYANHDSKFQGIMQHTSELSAIYYPQFLAKTVAVNAPSWAVVLMRALLAAFPTTFMEKIAVCPQANVGKGDKSAAECPFLAKFGGTAACVPPFLGGTMECPHGLTPKDDGARSLKRHNVPARSKQDFEFHTYCEAAAEWELVVEEHGIGVHAVFLSDSNPASPFDPGYEPAYGAPGEVLAATKIKADEGLKSGRIMMPGKGLLRVTLDNTHSMLRSKNVQFRLLIVIEPQPET